MAVSQEFFVIILLPYIQLTISNETRFYFYSLIENQYFFIDLFEFNMQPQDQRNSQFMITKEVFIDHIPSQIQQHYQINPHCLGQGGFGKVFQARKKKRHNETSSKEWIWNSFSSFQTSSLSGQDQQDRSQLRAIKQISYQKNEDKVIMKNEIQILSYLDHPYVMKLYETYEYKKHLYLVTDLSEGGDLFTVIEDKDRLNEQSVKVIFQQLIKAVSYLNSQHICHRDLKLQNILFLDKDSYNIKLIDFGLAFCWGQDMKQQLKRSGQNKKMAGTPDYMSPQILSNNYDQRCDIWSAGVILYMLLSGVSPFSGDNNKEIIQSIKNLDFTCQIPEMENVSEEAKNLINKILKPDDQRISLQQILDHPWLKQDSKNSPKCSEVTSVASVSSQKRSRLNSSKLSRKFKRTKSFDRLKRKIFDHTFQNQQSEFGCGSSYSQELTMDHRVEQLSVEKLQYYSNLPKLRKLHAIYSVSKLSESKTKSFGSEFIAIDKDNDGTVSLQDLCQYLFQMQKFCDRQRTQFFFNQLALSQRGHISYTQYLACVLSYQSNIKAQITSSELEFDQTFPYNEKIALVCSSDPLLIQHIDICEEHTFEDLFFLLDKDRDGFICHKDFTHIFQSSGIQDINSSFLEQLQEKLHEISKTSFVNDQYSQETTQWQQDPRKFKQLLSRTYKGQKDGGTCIDFQRFKHLMRTH